MQAVEDHVTFLSLRLRPRKAEGKVEGVLTEMYFVYCAYSAFCRESAVCIGMAVSCLVDGFVFLAVWLSMVPFFLNVVVPT